MLIEKDIKKKDENLKKLKKCTLTFSKENVQFQKIFGPPPPQNFMLCICSSQELQGCEKILIYCLSYTNFIDLFIIVYLYRLISKERLSRDNTIADLNRSPCRSQSALHTR